jgi:hypothetical protein
MAENLGTIKIMEGRIITRKSDITQVWSTGGGDPYNYIVYNGIVYKLLGKESDKAVEVVKKKKYEEIEEDIDNLEDFE